MFGYCLSKVWISCMYHYLQPLLCKIFWTCKTFRGKGMVLLFTLCLGAATYCFKTDSWSASWKHAEREMILKLKKKLFKTLLFHRSWVIPISVMTAILHGILNTTFHIAVTTDQMWDLYNTLEENKFIFDNYICWYLTYCYNTWKNGLHVSQCFFPKEWPYREYLCQINYLYHQVNDSDEKHHWSAAQSLCFAHSLVMYRYFSIDLALRAATPKSVHSAVFYPACALLNTLWSLCLWLWPWTSSLHSTTLSILTYCRNTVSGLCGTAIRQTEIKSDCQAQSKGD